MSELPLGWIERTLGEVADWGSGGTPKAGTSAYYDGSIPWAVIGDLADGVIHQTARSITDLGLRNSSAKVVGSDVVLIAMYGSIGKLGLPAIALATNQAIAYARPNPDSLTRDYLFYYLMHARRDLVAAGKGATQQNISQTILKSWPIPVPELDEQKLIVAAIEEQFSRLDVGIAALNRARANINRLKSTVLSFVSEGTSAWIPLGEIADVVGGVTKDTKKQNDPAFVEVPYLRVANVQRGYLDLNQVTTIRVPSATAQKLQLEPGDILFNEGGDRDKLGRGWVWEGQIPGCIHQNHVFRARLLDDSYEPKFISMHGNSFGRAWFDKNGKQTTNLASLSLTMLKSFPVPKISIEVQREIVAEVERRLSLLSVIQEETYVALRRSASLRASVLESAFSGKLT